MRSDVQVFRDDRVSLAGDFLFAGTRKLAQRFLLELLTDVGTMKYLPHRGTEFLHACRTGSTEFDVVVAFAAARAKIRRLFKADEARMPKNERLSDASVDEIVLANDELTLVLTVKSQAGPAVQVATPPIRLR